MGRPDTSALFLHRKPWPGNISTIAMWEALATDISTNVIHDALSRPGILALLLLSKSWACQGHRHCCYTGGSLGQARDISTVVILEEVLGQGHQHCCYTGSLGQARDISTVVTQKALGRPRTSALCYTESLSQARDISTLVTREEAFIHEVIYKPECYMSGRRI